MRRPDFETLMLVEMLLLEPHSKQGIERRVLTAIFFK